MIKLLRNVMYTLIFLAIALISGVLILSNPEMVAFDMIIAKLALPLGVWIVAAMSAGVLFGFFADEVVNFTSSRIRKRQVKKLEKVLEKKTLATATTTNNTSS